MLTMWGRRGSANVQAAMWGIGELGLPHERVDAGFIYGVNDTPEFLAMNPTGLIPVIRDGAAEPVWETGAILRYLANRYGEGEFWPSDPAARAKVDKWAEWSKISVATRFTQTIFWQLVRAPSKDRDTVAIGKAAELVFKQLAIAEAELTRHSYLAGDAFTLADIQLGHILFRYYDVAIERPDLPALRAYYDRLSERPAYREHVMVDYDELKMA